MNGYRNFSLNGWRVLAFSPDGALLAQFRQGILRVLSTSDFREAWKTELYDKREIENPPVREPGVTFSPGGDSSSLVVHVFGATERMLWDAHLRPPPQMPLIPALNDRGLIGLPWLAQMANGLLQQETIIVLPS